MRIQVEPSSTSQQARKLDLLVYAKIILREVLGVLLLPLRRIAGLGVSETVCFPLLSQPFEVLRWAI